nr:PREDICTED: uncharacterized protein LOC105663565 [Megachile rotundata]
MCNVWAKKMDDDEFESWRESHEEVCAANHSGSAGKIEIDAVVEMFLRSLKRHDVKYTTYIGDGDTKTFNGILKYEPYGKNVVVNKKECVGHVEKRMGARLRNAKKTNKGIGGKGAGKLTDKVIGELTKYYGLAIRRNSNSVDEMRKTIWATYYQKSSTNEKPQHSFCPSDLHSWCKYRKSEAEESVENFTRNKLSLSDKVLKILKPIYEDLTSTNLLERCIGAETQNNNESLNSLIWTFAPKHIHCGARTVQIATFLATCIFNEGLSSVLQIMHVMGLSIAPQTDMFCVRRDSHRIQRSERWSTEAAKRARIDIRENKVAQQEFHETEEGVLYGPGIAD